MNWARPCSKAILISSINGVSSYSRMEQICVTLSMAMKHGLTYMEQDGAWGDHLILCAAANCFETCIHVVSSLHNDVVIRPHCPVDESKPLVLGYIHKVHYVSLQPIQGKKGKAYVTLFSI